MQMSEKDGAIYYVRAGKCCACGDGIDLPESMQAMERKELKFLGH